MREFPASTVVGFSRKLNRNDDSFGGDLVEQPAAFEAALRFVRPDYIFHLAGSTGEGEWNTLFRDNVQTTQNVLASVASVHPTARVVLPGSAAEYGVRDKSDILIKEDASLCPGNAYGVTKMFQTLLSCYYARCGVDVVVGRIFNVIGVGLPKSSAIGTFTLQLLEARRQKGVAEIRVGNLHAQRDFVDVEDVCRALFQLAEKGRKGEVYNICSGRAVRMSDVLQLMIQQSGLEVKVVGERGRFCVNDIPRSVGSGEKIFSETGWKPRVCLDDAIARLFSGKEP